MQVRTEAQKERKRITNAAWRLANQERIVASRAAYLAANKEKIALRRIQHYQKNLEKAAAYVLAWRRANPAIVNARNARRKAAKIRATPAWSDREAVELIYKQAQLLSVATGSSWHVDHIVPLRSSLVCGLHVHVNLQVLPYTTNCSKGNRHWPDMP